MFRVTGLRRAARLETEAVSARGEDRESISKFIHVKTRQCAEKNTLGEPLSKFSHGRADRQGHKGGFADGHVRHAELAAVRQEEDHRGRQEACQGEITSGDQCQGRQVNRRQIFSPYSPFPGGGLIRSVRWAKLE